MSEFEYETLLATAKLSCEEAVAVAERNLEQSSVAYRSAKRKDYQMEYLSRSIGDTIMLIFAKSNLAAVTNPTPRVEWNPDFPGSNYRYGAYPYGGDTFEEATCKWLAVTVLTDAEKCGEISPSRSRQLSQALTHIRLLYPKRYPIDVWIRVGELMSHLPK